MSEPSKVPHGERPSQKNARDRQPWDPRGNPFTNHFRNRSSSGDEMDDLDPVTYLPAELFQHVLGYLDAPDLARAATVNKLWNTLASDGVLWHLLCRGRWQGKRYMRRVYRIGIPFLSQC